MNDVSPVRITGIGSLPHTNPKDAVQFVARYSPEIPFWAQLPQRTAGDNMLTQMLMPLRDLLTPRRWGQLEIKQGALGEFRRRLRNAAAELEPTTAAGFFAFESAARDGLYAEAQALKGQLTGPITLARCLFYQDRALITHPQVCEELTDYVYRLGLWQAVRLGALDKPVWLFLDEPALAIEPTPPAFFDALQELVAAFRADGIYTGIHCCATRAPIALCDLQPNLISFDAHQGLELFLAAPEVREFIASGGALGIGMIPTVKRLAPHTAAECFARWLTALDETLPLEDLVQRSVWTATCGLGLLDAPAARESFSQVRQLAQMAQEFEPYAAELEPA